MKWPHVISIVTLELISFHQVESKPNLSFNLVSSILPIYYVFSQINLNNNNYCTGSSLASSSSSLETGEKSKNLFDCEQLTMILVEIMDLDDHEEILMVVPSERVKFSNCFIQNFQSSASAVKFKFNEEWPLLSVLSCRFYTQEKSKIGSNLWKIIDTFRRIIIMCDGQEATSFLKQITTTTNNNNNNNNGSELLQQKLSRSQWIIYVRSEQEFNWVKNVFQQQELTSSSNSKKTEKSNLSSHFLLDSTVLLVFQSAIFRVYRPTESANVIIEPQLRRDTPRNRQVNWANFGENQRSNLHQNELKVSAVMDHVYDFDTSFTKDLNGQLFFGESFAVQVLWALEFTLNFRTVVVITDTWGYYDDTTKKWKGMIADLLDNKADLTISSASDLPFRRKVIDFNMPTNSLQLTTFFKKPRSSTHPLALFRPFTNGFWLALFIWLITVSLTLIVFKIVLLRVHRSSSPSSSSFSTTLSSSSLSSGNKAKTTTTTRRIVSHHRFPYYKLIMMHTINHFPTTKLSTNDNNPEDDDHHNNKNKINIIENNQVKMIKVVTTTTTTNPEISALWEPSDCFQWALGTLCLQGFYEIPNFLSYRILIGICCLVSVIVYGSYAGTLISFLSVASRGITNLEQLLNTHFTFSIVDSPVSTNFFRESPSEHDREIYRRRRTTQLYNGIDEAKDELLAGSFVFVVDHSNGYNGLNTEFSPQEACQINEVGIPYAKQKQGTMLRKMSPYKRVVDYQILRMHEYGLIQRWTHRYLQSRPTCDEVAIFLGVELTSVIVAFALLAIGGVLALAIFLVEMLKISEKLKSHLNLASK